MLAKDQVLRLAEQIQGWCTRTELEWLYDQAEVLQPGGTWLEVGTWKGRSLCPVIFAVPTMSTVYSVDSFQGHPKSPTYFEAQLNGGKWVQNHVNLLLDLVEKLRLIMPTFRGVIAHSDSASTQFIEYGVRLDVIYLDADYRDQVSLGEEIVRWKSLLNSYGMLCGRNYGSKVGEETPSEMHKIVIEVVDRLLPNRKRGPDSIWYWRKGG